MELQSPVAFEPGFRARNYPVSLLQFFLIGGNRRGVHLLCCQALGQGARCQEASFSPQVRDCGELIEWRVLLSTYYSWCLILLSFISQCVDRRERNFMVWHPWLIGPGCGITAWFVWALCASLISSSCQASAFPGKPFQHRQVWSLLSLPSVR